MLTPDTATSVETTVSYSTTMRSMAWASSLERNQTDGGPQKSSLAFHDDLVHSNARCGGRIHQIVSEMIFAVAFPFSA